MSNDLLDELRTAYQTRMAARETWAKSRESVGTARLLEREARAEYERAAAAIEEIEKELLTGESSLPLLAAARRNGQTDAPAVAAGETLSEPDDRPYHPFLKAAIESPIGSIIGGDPEPANGRKPIDSTTLTEKFADQLDQWPKSANGRTDPADDSPGFTMAVSTDRLTAAEAAAREPVEPARPKRKGGRKRKEAMP
jgi:hypothetical protein